MNVEQLSMRISAKYPNYFAKKETRAVWETDYRHALEGLDDEQIESAFDRVMAKWDNPWPPYPRDFVAAAPKKKAAGESAAYTLAELHEYADEHWTVSADRLRALYRQQFQVIEKDDMRGYRFGRETECAAKRAAQHAFLITKGLNARPLDICNAEDRQYLSSTYGECNVLGGDFFANYCRQAGLEVPASGTASSPPTPEDIQDKPRE